MKIYYIIQRHDVVIMFIKMIPTLKNFLHFIRNLKSILRNIRPAAEAKFHDIFVKAEKLKQKNGKGGAS